MRDNSLFREGMTAEQKIKVLEDVIKKLSNRPNPKNIIRLVPDVIHVKVEANKPSKIFLPAGKIGELFYSVSIKETVNDKERTKPLVINVSINDGKIAEKYGIQAPLNKIETKLNKDVSKKSFCEISFDDERITDIDITMLFYINILQFSKTLEEIVDEGI